MGESVRVVASSSDPVVLRSSTEIRTLGGFILIVFYTLHTINFTIIESLLT